MRSCYNLLVINKQLRYPIIDLMRVLAIVLMVIFHMFYDLTIFGFTNIDFQQNKFWFGLPRFIVFLFLTCVGLSQQLSHKDAIDWSKFWKRWLKLVFFAFCVSATTYYLYPKNWIYFGTLHCIATVSLMALPFRNNPKIALAIGIAILVNRFVFQNVIDVWPYIKSMKSMDYIPYYPWVAIVLIAIFLHSKGFHKVSLDLGRNKTWIEWTSRNSLWIYILHQPIMYFLIFVFHKIIH